jgi:hypothetical protein
MFFLFVSKRKNQRKTAICLAFTGAWTPANVHLRGAAQQKPQKRKPAFRPSTWVEAGFSLLLSFLLKKKEESCHFARKRVKWGKKHSVRFFSYIFI